MDEYAGYYAKCLVPPPNHAARIHAFSRPASSQAISGWIRRSASRAEQVRQEIQAGYLGSVVVRPIPGLPIGRTVLRPLTNDAERHIECLRGCRCHLLGFELSVRGLAFQQQDRAVGACATTALWSALSRVCHVDGYRAPTPMAITEAAVRHLLVQGRPFPSGGLTVEQMYEALRSFEFGPDVVRCDTEPTLAALQLRIYLESGIPAVMSLSIAGQAGQVGHAVTAVGYRASRSTLSIGQGTMRIGLGAGIAVLYINDDRLGPYARCKMTTISEYPGLAVEIDWPSGKVETAAVKQLICPLYAKLRMTAKDLLWAAGGLWVRLAQCCPLGLQPELAMRFTRSGDYLSTVAARCLDPVRAGRLLRSACFSRYVGLCEYTDCGIPMVDANWDTTDPVRSSGDPARTLLALVARSAQYRQAVDDLADELGIVAG